MIGYKSFAIEFATNLPSVKELRDEAIIHNSPTNHNVFQSQPGQIFQFSVHF